jgi:hypothetical protein
MRFPFLLRALSGLALLLLVPPAARAGEVSKTVTFSLGTWEDLAASDGPVTIHRVRVEKQSGITKSKLFRPGGGSSYAADVQVQIEFTNDATHDWEAEVEIEWLDKDGVAIDGYRGTESLDSESRHDIQTVTLSTLRYGLDRAKKLRVRLDFHPE